MISVLLLALLIVMPKLALSGVVLKFRGCYKDSVDDRDLPLITHVGGVITENVDYDTCANLCRERKFFGRQWKNQCFCGNEMGKHGEADDPSDCNCDKDAANHGPDVNCVYEREERPAPPAITAGVEEELSIPLNTALDISSDMIRQPGADENTCANAASEDPLSKEECKQFARRRDQLPIGHNYFKEKEYQLTVLVSDSTEIGGCFILCYPGEELQCRLMYNDHAGSDKAVAGEKRYKLCKRTDDDGVSCTGSVGYGGYHCCTENTKCGDGQGDCDNDDQCEGDGFCGIGCVGNGFYSDQDCCKLCNGVDDCCTAANPCKAGSGKCTADDQCHGRAWCDVAGFCRDCSDGEANCCANAKQAGVDAGFADAWGCPEGYGGCTNSVDCKGNLVCGKFGESNCMAFDYFAGTSFTDGDKCCQKPECHGSDYNCCAEKQDGCLRGEGDCDDDAECNGALVCGRDNCHTMFSDDSDTWRNDEDCCINPNERYIYMDSGKCDSNKILSYEECNAEAQAGPQAKLNRYSTGAPYGCYRAAKDSVKEFFWGNNKDSDADCSSIYECRCHS